MRMPRFRSFFLFMFIMVVVLGGAAYAALSRERARTIKAVCANAQSEFNGSTTIEALVAYLNSESTDLAERNRVVWVLGELRDERALPVLRALSGSDVCDHEHYVCQYEISKAIKKIEGHTFNPFFWQRIST